MKGSRPSGFFFPQLKRPLPHSNTVVFLGGVRERASCITQKKVSDFESLLKEAGRSFCSAGFSEPCFLLRQIGTVGFFRAGRGRALPMSPLPDFFFFGEDPTPAALRLNVFNGKASFFDHLLLL